MTPHRSVQRIINNNFFSPPNGVHEKIAHKKGERKTLEKGWVDCRMWAAALPSCSCATFTSRSQGDEDQSGDPTPQALPGRRRRSNPGLQVVLCLSRSQQPLDQLVL